MFLYKFCPTESPCLELASQLHYNAGQSTCSILMNLPPLLNFDQSVIPGGGDALLAMQLTAAIRKTLLEIYRLAGEQKRPTNVVANALDKDLFGLNTTVC